MLASSTLIFKRIAGMKHLAGDTITEGLTIFYKITNKNAFCNSQKCKNDSQKYF